MTLGRRLAFLLVIAVALALPQPRAAHAQGFTGAGSTLAWPILGQWGRAFATQQGEGGAVVDGEGGLDYEAVGSLAGVMRVLDGAVEFGVTDVPLSPAEIAQHRLAQFPIVIGGVAIVANVAGLRSATLRLSGEVVARIYLGEIRRWSDPAIAALNPGLALPDAPIVVVHREDGSGSTYHFARWLAEASPAWLATVGVNTLLDWPVGRGTRGSEGVASLLRATPNAIGYLEAGQAGRLNLPVALARNQAGAFVAPTTAALREAAAAARWDAAQHFHDARPPASAAGAYPITATVYALMPRRPTWPARSRRALAFFELALGQRAADAERLGYVPLPEPVVAQVTQYWRATLGTR